MGDRASSLLKHAGPPRHSHMLESGEPQRARFLWPGIVCVSAGLLLASDALHARQPEVESAEAYELAANAVLPMLREDLRGLLDAHRASLTRGLFVPHSESTDVPPGEAGAHYVFLDIAAEASDAPTATAPTMLAERRRQAVAAFPRDREDAERLFRRQKRPAGGSLPWELAARHAELIEAIRGGTSEQAAELVGRIIHLSVDAALPFHSTVNGEGALTGNLRWTPEGVVSPTSWIHHSVGHRTQVALLKVFRDQFEHEVRVWPGRLTPCEDPLAVVFDTLVRAHATALDLEQIDLTLTSRLGLTGEAAFLAFADEYYRELEERAGPILETQLERGTLLAANMLEEAWRRAGYRVAPPTDVPPPAGDVLPSAGEETLTGSQQSTVYHRSSCPHVRRIRADNRVEFASPSHAIQAGRTPCRTCNPATP